MMTQFKPDYVSAPGQTLREILDNRRWSGQMLARKMHYSRSFIQNLLNGRAQITADVALALEAALGGPPAEFWMNREVAYRLWLARRERALNNGPELMQ